MPCVCVQRPSLFPKQSGHLLENHVINLDKKTNSGDSSGLDLFIKCLKAFTSDDTNAWQRSCEVLLGRYHLFKSDQEMRIFLQC